MIRIGAHRRARAAGVARGRETARDARTRTDRREVAEQAKLPLKQVQEVRVAARAVASLDRPVGEDDSMAYGDLFAATEATPDEQVECS